MPGGMAGGALFGTWALGKHQVLPDPASPLPSPPRPMRGWRRPSWRQYGTTTWSWCRRFCGTWRSWRSRAARPRSWPASSRSPTSRFPPGWGGTWDRTRGQGLAGSRRWDGKGPQGTAPWSLLFPPPPQSLLETHDSVASKTYETPPPSPGLDPTFSNQPVPPDAVRMVGIRKTAGEHLVRVPGRAWGSVWKWGRESNQQGSNPVWKGLKTKVGSALPGDQPGADPGDRRRAHLSRVCTRTRPSSFCPLLPL